MVYYKLNTLSESTMSETNKLKHTRAIEQSRTDSSILLVSLEKLVDQYLKSDKTIPLLQLLHNELERPLVEIILKRTNNDFNQVAGILGITMNQLRKRLAFWGML